jgi:nitrogen fixation/metabolism regulation signal transduction histidine kinase
MGIIIFLHVLGAIAAGYYLIFPLLIKRTGKLSAAAQEGYVNVLHVMNRIGQYVFIAQLLTGGYLISQKEYDIIWIVVVLAVFVLMAALAGMMGRPLKRMIENIKTGKEIQALKQKVTLFSVIIAISYLILVIMMSFPTFR